MRWTAPTSGTASISGFFELLDTNPTGIIGEVFDNGTEVNSGTLTSPGATHPSTTGVSEAFSFAVPVKAGDVIWFGVNNDGDFLDDSTGVEVNITTTSGPASVPEPGTLMLFGAGFLGLALRCRKRLA